MFCDACGIVCARSFCAFGTIQAVCGYSLLVIVCGKHDVIHRSKQSALEPLLGILFLEYKKMCLFFFLCHCLVFLRTLVVDSIN